MDSNDNDNVILYDIVEYLNWLNSNKESNLALSNENQNLTQRFLIYLKNLIKFKVANETSISQIIESSTHRSWNKCKLAISNSKYTLAILKENELEVFLFVSNSDTYERYWRKEFSTDFISLCCLTWNNLSNILVVSTELAQLIFYDECGKKLLEFKDNEANDYENSFIKISFMPEKYVQEARLSEIREILVTISYSSVVTFFGLNFKQNFVRKLKSVSLKDSFPSGLFACTIDTKYNCLVLGGFANDNKRVSSYSSINGISIWRFVNTEPWLQLISLKDIKSDNEKYINKNDFVRGLSISKNNSTLAVVYQSGALSFYSLPNLIHLKTWLLNEQPSYNETNEEALHSPSSIKKFKRIYSSIDHKISDISWWNDNTLIVTRGTGSFTFCASNDNLNLSKLSQYWLNPYAMLYAHPKNGFLVLDCECKLYDLNSEDNSTSVDEVDVDDDENETWYSSLLHMFKHQVYNLTHIEKFKPNDYNKEKYLQMKQRLLHFKPTTPEELFQKKLELEEYGEALQLAKAYQLDTDLVYQKQWRTKQMSKSSINDFLSKIKKRSWILDECLKRVPENLDTTKYLIEFGLRGTDIDSLLAIAQGELDEDLFYLSKNLDVDFEDDDEYYDRFNSNHVKEREKKLRELRQYKIKLINFDSLNEVQLDLCVKRLKLLEYQDKLVLYEKILGGGEFAVNRYDPKRYLLMRDKSPLEIANMYAQESNPQAVETILSNYLIELQPHLLDILNNFPETLSPNNYEALLPKIRDNQDVCLFDEMDTIRNELDWVEYKECLQKLQIPPKKSPECNLTKELVEKWYEERIVQIEEYCHIAENSLVLCELAVKKGCPTLKINEIHENLLTLDTLVYECRSTDKRLSLNFVEKITDVEKLKLLMSHVNTHELYTKRIIDWLIPFLSRKTSLKQQEDILKEYLCQQNDLNSCRNLVDLQKTRQDLELLQRINLESLIIDCMYLINNKTQVDLYPSLIASFTSNSQKVAKIRTDYKCLEIYRKYGIHKTLGYIREITENNEKSINSLIQLTHLAASSQTPNWTELMKAIEYLQQNLFRNTISLQKCNEIFLESLLLSRSADNIQLAKEFWLKDFFIIDMSAACSLCLHVAQQYFNSASNCHDLDIDFSSEILDLIDTKSVEPENYIKEQVAIEYDLINSIRLINGEFKYELLPVKLRYMDELNRLNLLKTLFKLRTNLHEKLVRLCDKLRLSNESKNEIMLFIGEYSLETLNDEQLGIDMMSKLIQQNYTKSWLLSKNLAIKLKSLNKFDEKMIEQLMAFSLTHCPSEHLMELIEFKAELLTESSKQSHEESNYDSEEKVLKITEDNLCQTNYLKEYQLVSALIKHHDFNDTHFYHYFNQLIKYDPKLAKYLLVNYLSETNVKILKQYYQFDSSKSYAFLLDCLRLSNISTNILDQIEDSFKEYSLMKQLNQLNIGIDLGRFKHDANYKLETIKGLAMSQETFELACQLALYSSIDLWTIYLIQVECLFETCTEVDELEKKIEPLLSILNTRQNEFENYLVKNIQELIDGSDLNRIKYLYKVAGHTYEDHFRLLNKITKANLSLNYKQLIHKPIETIEKLIDNKNLNFFAKISNVLGKITNVASLNQSKVFIIYYLKQFWSTDTPKNQIFDDLKEYLTKIDVTQEETLKEFIENLFLNKKSVDISIRERKELYKRYLKYLKTRIDVNKSHILIDIESHLNKFEKLYQIESEAVTIESIKILEIDFIESNWDNIKEILISFTLNGLSIDQLDYMITQLSPTNDYLKLQDLTNNSINHLFELIPHDATYLDKLKFLLISVSSNSNLIDINEIMNILRQFVNNDKIALALRLELLEQIKNVFSDHLNETDLILLFVAKTNAILKGFNQQITTTDIETEDKRYSLFNRLLGSVETEDDCQVLINLLYAWPSFQSIHQIEVKPWNLLLVKFISTKTSTSNLNFINLIRKLISQSVLFDYDILFILNEFKKSSDLFIQLSCLKLLLLFKNRQLIDDFLKETNLLESIQIEFDSELMNILLDSNYYYEYLNTKLYKLFIDYLIKFNYNDDIVSIIKYLSENNCSFEAAKLTREHRQPTNFYKSLNLSFSLFNKFK